MKLSITFLIIMLLFFPPLQASNSGTRCVACQERRSEDRKTISIVLSGIAQIANGLAMLLSSNKETRNEGVCNFVAGACTVAAQASKSNSIEDTPADLYALLSEPTILAAVTEILQAEGINITEIIPDKALDLTEN